MVEVRSVDMEDAERYLRLRLSLIGRYDIYLDARIREAVREICRIVYGRRLTMDVLRFSFGMDRSLRMEIDGVVDALWLDISSFLGECMDALREDGEESMVGIIGSMDGQSVKEKYDIILGKWRGETEALVASSLLIEMSEEEAEDAVWQAERSDPWTSSLWEAGLVLGAGRAASSILREGGVNYGRGRSNSAVRMLTMAGGNYIARAIGEEQRLDHPNAVEFASITADGNACENCVDEESRGWQPIGNYIGPWHPNCRCRFVFR